MLSLGTAAIGRPQYINLRLDDAPPLDLAAFRERGRSVLDRAYELGIRYYDTAPGYGLAEDLLIEWVHQKGDADVEVATKWGYTYTANFDPNATQHEVKEHSLHKLNEQWAVSQQLLPYLKTYQIHSATFATGVLRNQPILERLAELKAEHGLLIGITASGADQVAVAKAALDVRVNGQPLFDTFQITYNILDQSLATLSDEMQAMGKRLIIKEALANGRIFPNPQYPHYQPLYDALYDLAAHYQVGIDAIALRFCMDRLQPFTVLSGADRLDYLEANLKAAMFQLTDAELDRLATFAISPDAYWEERSRLEWQ